MQVIKQSNFASTPTHLDALMFFVFFFQTLPGRCHPFFDVTWKKTTWVLEAGFLGRVLRLRSWMNLFVFCWCFLSGAIPPGDERKAKAEAETMGFGRGVVKRSPETSAPVRTKRNLHERPSLGLAGILASHRFRGCSTVFFSDRRDGNFSNFTYTDRNDWRIETQRKAYKIDMDSLIWLREKIGFTLDELPNPTGNSCRNTVRWPDCRFFWGIHSFHDVLSWRMIRHEGPPSH